MYIGAFAPTLKNQRRENTMKRYVKELAADILHWNKAGLHKTQADSDCRDGAEEEIKNTLFFCEKGFITEFEAVKKLISIREKVLDR